MRAVLVFPLLLLSLAFPGRSVWGAPPSGAGMPGAGGVTVGAGTAAPAAVAGPRSGGGARAAAAPANFPGANNRGGINAPTGAMGYRAPGVNMAPGPGVRYAPITAGARPVGRVVTPRPVVTTTTPAVVGAPRPVNVRPTLPVARPNPPFVGMNRFPVRPSRPVVAPSPPPSRLTTFAAAAAAARDGRGDGTAFPVRPDRPRPSRGYISYPNNLGQSGLRPGHYVPGESYVIETGNSGYGYPYGYPYGAGPAIYLGGAFPYFYGGSVGSFGGYASAGYDTPTPLVATPAAATPEVAAPPAPVSPDAAPAAPAPSPGAASTEPNSLVEAVQAELTLRGYFGGRPDGVFGADTGEALRRFQENHGLARTGLVNEATLFALGLN